MLFIHTIRALQPPSNRLLLTHHSFGLWCASVIIYSWLKNFKTHTLRLNNTYNSNKVICLGIQWQSTVNTSSQQAIPEPAHCSLILSAQKHKGGKHVWNSLTLVDIFTGPVATSFTDLAVKSSSSGARWHSALVLQQLLPPSVCCGGNPFEWQLKLPISGELSGPPCISYPIRG